MVGSVCLYPALCDLATVKQLCPRFAIIGCVFLICSSMLSVLFSLKTCDGYRIDTANRWFTHDLIPLYELASRSIARTVAHVCTRGGLAMIGESIYAMPQSVMAIRMLLVLGYTLRVIQSVNE